MIKRILLFAFTAMILLSSTKIALAAFVVTPMEFHLALAPGDDNTQTFYVRNRGEEVIALKVYVNDFWIEPDGSEIFLEPGEVEYSCAHWIEFAPEELELAPDESRAVRFKLNVPPGKIGTYWAMIFVEQTTKPTIKSAKRGEQQFNILSFQRVGVRVFENTPGTDIGEGRITEVNVETGEEDRLLKVGLKFENGGNILLKCKGSVEIKDEIGETVESVEIREFNCYPGSERISQAVIEKELVPGQYTALAVVDYGAEFLVAGEAVFMVEGKAEGDREDVTIDTAVEEGIEALGQTTGDVAEGVDLEEVESGVFSFTDKIEQVSSKVRGNFNRVILPYYRQKVLSVWQWFRERLQYAYELFFREK